MTRSTLRVAAATVGAWCVLASALGAQSSAADARVGGTGRLLLDSATVASSPARTLADLLSGRVAGLNVTYTTGAPGFAPELTARGSASRYGPERPLLFVDGVLMREDPHQLGLGEALDRQVPAPAWSLPTSEIAEVEVVLGPASGTLLAFGAPRGAVLVRTRRGGGAWRSTASLEAVQQSAPAPFTSRLLYRGLVIGGGATDFCPLTDQATGYCVQTGSYTARPFGGRSPFRASAGMRAGVAATGDTRLASLRVGATFDQAPSVLVRDVAERVDLSASARTREWRGLSATLDARFARHGAGYVRRGAGGVGELGTNLIQPTDTGFSPAARSVDSILARATPYRSDRTSAALGVRWAPWEGLLVHAQATTTRATRSNDLTTALYSGFAPFDYGGTERTANAYREGLGAGTIGVRYTRALWRGIRATGELGGSRTNVDVTERRQRIRLDPSGASSVEDRWATPDIRSSAFLVGARLDFGPTRSIGGGFRKETTTLFGLAYGDDPFNTIEAAWTLSRERFFPRLPGVDRLHLRAAYGESGDHEAVLAVGTAFAFGSGAGTYGVPRRLQRTLEREAGADLDLFRGRLQVRGTAFTRALRDGYLPTNLPPSSAAPPLMLVSWVTHGHEWSLVRPARGTGRFRWDGALSWSSARTRIAPSSVVASQATLQGGSIVRFAPGERFGALWVARHYSRDANADGVIDATEITIGVPRAVGVTQPTDLLGVTLSASWRDWLRAGLALDGKFGHLRADGTARYACQALVCDGLYGGTRDAQARAVASGYSGSWTGPLHAADFVRAREIWMRVALPPRLMPRALGSAALTLSVRNAGSWSRYPSGDPEVGSFAFATVQRGDYFTPALPRLVSLRLDLTP